MERIEFCFFDAGGGHRAAATALQMAIESQHRPWEIQLTNLQELLDPLDIVRKYAGIRIQDTYNMLLRNGWTLGSTQLMRMLQVVIRIYHRPTVRFLAGHWKETKPDLVVSFVPHFNRAIQESLERALPGHPFLTVLTDIADFPPHFWIERKPQYFVCGSEKAVQQAHEMGHPDEHIFPASGMILHPRFYEPRTADPLAERERLGLRRDLPTGLVLFGGHGSHVMRDIAERLNRSKLELQLILICGKNEALAMHLPVIVECNAWTLPQERYNTVYVQEKEVGVVLHHFTEIEGAVAKLIEPSALSRYRGNTTKLENRAVFEVADILNKI